MKHGNNDFGFIVFPGSFSKSTFEFTKIKPITLIGLEPRDKMIKMKLAALILALIFSSGINAQDDNPEKRQQLNCVGEMEIGGRGVDIGEGIALTINLDIIPVTINIMGKEYEVEVSDRSYTYSPKHPKDDGFNIDRYTLEVTWVALNYADQSALIFSGTCSVLAERLI